MCCSRTVSRCVHKTGLGGIAAHYSYFQNFRQAPRTFNVGVPLPWWGDQMNTGLVRIAQLCL